MKADLKEVVTRTVTLEMSYEEAVILRALVGGVSKSSNASHATWRAVTGIWSALTDAGVDGGEMTFSDLFEGRLSVK